MIKKTCPHCLGVLYTIVLGGERKKCVPCEGKGWIDSDAKKKKPKKKNRLPDYQSPFSEPVLQATTSENI